MMSRNKCNFAIILCQFFKVKWLFMTLFFAFSVWLYNGYLWKWKLVSDLLLNFVSQKWFHFYFPYCSISAKGLQHSFYSSSIDHSHICNFPILPWSAGICSWEVNSKVKCSCLPCVKCKLCNLLLHFSLIIFITRCNRYFLTLLGSNFSLTFFSLICYEN